MIDIEFVTCSQSPEVLHGQLLRSKIFYENKIAFHVNKDVDNIPHTFNAFGPISDLTAFIHHDVFLPDGFEAELERALLAMAKIDPNWAILGVAGVQLVDGKRVNQGHIRDRGKEWGYKILEPVEVDTLDEMLLITHGDMQFDNQFPFDFYGADLCMQARAHGRKCYVIDAYCHHNSSRPFSGEGLRTPSYYESREKFRQKWKEFLPIVTTTGIIE